jgi:hypothetical protein
LLSLQKSIVYCGFDIDHTSSIVALQRTLNERRETLRKIRVNQCQPPFRLRFQEKFRSHLISPALGISCMLEKLIRPHFRLLEKTNVFGFLWLQQMITYSDLYF